MAQPGSDTLFAGSIPELYDRLMVPMIFQPYADDLARRLAERAPQRVLETAAGTGAVTRALLAALPADTELVATDLNQPMLDRAAAVGTSRPVTWQQADAMALPFADESFDAVVCQFGVMFFPDKVHALAEARRVLRPGGALLFNVWDRLEENEFTHEVTMALARLYPADPPRFMARTPHGYHQWDAVLGDLAAAGFAAPRVAIDTVAAQSRAPSAREPAQAFCHGTPLRNEIEARASTASLAEATVASEEALVHRFGAGPITGKIQAHVVVALK